MNHLDSLPLRRGAAALAAGLLLALTAACTTVADDLAAAAPEAAQALPPTTAGTATLDLAEQALYEGRVDDARALLSRAMLRAGTTVRARLIAAEVQLASGAYRSAATAFGALTAEVDIKARALQGEGIARALAERDPGAGYASLRAAVALDPSLSRAWNALGYYHDSRREWRQAGESYTQALAADPESAMILNNRGFSMLMQGRIQEALADLGAALRRDPTLRPARENLRLALAWDGQYALALAGAEGGDRARVLNNVGYVALLRGDQANAEAFLLRAIEVDPAFNPVAARNLDYLRLLRGPSRSDGVPRPQ